MDGVSKIREEELTPLVEEFYARVRADPALGPIFNDAIDDWPEHLGKLTAFWSSVMLTSGRYKGQPVPAHLKHKARITPALFERWLALWVQTTNDRMTPEAAAALQAKARRIAESAAAAASRRAWRSAAQSARVMATRRRARAARPGRDAGPPGDKDTGRQPRPPSDRVLKQREPRRRAGRTRRPGPGAVCVRGRLSRPQERPAALRGAPAPGKWPPSSQLCRSARTPSPSP